MYLRIRHGRGDLHPLASFHYPGAYAASEGPGLYEQASGFVRVTLPPFPLLGEEGLALEIHVELIFRLHPDVIQRKADEPVYPSPQLPHGLFGTVVSHCRLLSRPVSG